MRSYSILATGLLLMVAAIPLPAQVTSGTIVGVVSDSTGAVIPNASVTLVHQATKDTRQTRTNDRGEFNVPFVRIGQYSISAETQGFRTQTQTGIAVQVDQTVQEGDVLVVLA